jgi:hypothetical protein
MDRKAIWLLVGESVRKLLECPCARKMPSPLAIEFRSTKGTYEDYYVNGSPLQFRAPTQQSWLENNDYGRFLADGDV